MAEIAYINVGKRRQIRMEGFAAFRSAIQKTPVLGKIFLDYSGLEGDQIGDPRVHGGEDKALCAYSLDHYPFWEAEMSRTLQPGTFGENLSIRGLAETQVAIGDVYRIGEAEVQVSQPRQPCHKLNKIFQRQEMACRVQTTGYTGFYLRVLKQGWVAPGAAMILLTRVHEEFTVQVLNQFLDRETKFSEDMLRALELPALAAAWKKDLKRRVDRKIVPPRTPG